MDPRTASLIQIPLPALEAIFDRSADTVFFVKDLQGCYLSVNQTLLERVGLKYPQELIGKTPTEVFPPSLGLGFAEQDQQVLTGELLLDQLELHLYASGGAGWCITHKVPLVHDSGEVWGMIGISKDLGMPDMTGTVYAEVARAVQFIQSDYMHNLTLQDLADAAGITINKLERHIRRIFGLTTYQLLLKTRIEQASRLLKTTQDSTAQIALACGFYDQSAFSKQFKAAVGMTPSHFRSLHVRS
ncbi:AraC family transcriptional regulator [Deinococcus roseus]|uniref:Transcriptional regulator n=1 Tax=Deinococcus roseus TaxID=392414 RepID=A0ABQ2CX61_9DEIO|nr:AraC family transcriptional regulator [Deinococcus roseus]GGJ29670.1 transcriptional regulator [Deinococcus roseus]